MESHNTLLSVLVELRAAAKSLVLGPLGIPLRAWFLEQIRSVDAPLAKKLHDNNGIKPYTVSTLLDEEGNILGPGRKLEPGDKCWVRITTYADYLSQVTYTGVLKNIREHQKPLSIFQMNFLATDATVDPYQHPLARKTTYAELAQSIAFASPRKEARLQFLSPTAFRSHGLDVPLPAPEMVFRSYWERWNANCPENMQINDEWPEFVRKQVKVIKIPSIQTMDWLVPGENKYERIIGFKGKVSFALSRKQRMADEPYWKDTLAVLQSLAEFAFFCGTGQHTSVGMGQTIVLDSP